MKKLTLLVALLATVAILMPGLVLAGCTVSISTGGGSGQTQTTASVVTGATPSTTTPPVASSATTTASTAVASSLPTTGTSEKPTSTGTTEEAKSSSTTKLSVIMNNLTLATLGYKLARFDNLDPRLAFQGAWYHYGMPGASGTGSNISYTEEIGASVTAKFTGTRVSIITATSNLLGKLGVILDGNKAVMVDCFTPYEGMQQVVWTSPELPAGSHYLRIECPGEKNPDSLGHSVFFDALDIVGVLQ